MAHLFAVGAAGRDVGNLARRLGGTVRVCRNARFMRRVLAQGRVTPPARPTYNGLTVSHPWPALGARSVCIPTRHWSYAGDFWAFRQAAHRFLVASLMALKPAADIFRFLGLAGVAGCACCCFCAAHLARCAAAILARPALLIVRRFAGPA